MTLRIQLLGNFRLQSGDETITTLTVPRLQSLLAFLVLHRETPQLRQHLAFLFWPDSTEAQARTNLRHALHDLRLVLPDAAAYLDIQTQWIQWRPGSDFRLDVAEFEAEAMQAAQWLQSQKRDLAVEALVRAVELYRGPLLSDRYEEWVLAKREELASHYEQSLHQLFHLLEHKQEYTAAIAYAQRLLRHDPFTETTYLRLMRLHILQGDRSAALRVYHKCVATLERELGVEPSAETRAAYNQLFNEELPVVVPVNEPPRTDDTSILIGREAEWQQLLLAWQHATQGKAHVVAISGEAGIGKTRLAESLVEWVSRQKLPVAVARAYEAEGGLAYAPLVDLLRTESVAANLSELGALWLAQVARLLPELHDHHPHLARSKSLPEMAQRHHFYEGLARAILGNGRSPLLVLDDLQWCDRETLKWLHYLLRFAPQSQLLLVVTVRSGEAAVEHPLHAFLLSLRRDHRLTEIPLQRLTHAGTAALAAQVAGRTLANEQIAKLYRQTEGNPLFVVEVVRSATSQGNMVSDTSSNSGRSIGTTLANNFGNTLPDSVQAVIQARLSRLTPLTKEVVQVAAAIGRSFSVGILAHAGGYSEDELVSALDELWQRHIVREQPPDEYDFGHPQIREVAYRQITPMRRRLLHRRVAQALESSYAQGGEAVSGLIAVHYELAGDAGQAIQAYRRAAAFAQQIYAYREAAEHLHQALALLSTLAGDHRLQELELQLDLGLALMMAKGYSDAEAQQAYNRALELSQATDANARLYEIIWGLHESYLFQGEFKKARAASEHCWHLAQQSGDPELLLQAHHTLWAVNFYTYVRPHGLQSVLEHTRPGITLYRPEWHRSHVVRYGGHDPGVCAGFIQAKALWLLGFPDQAVESAQDAVALATRLGHPFSLTLALSQGAKVHIFRGEPQRVLDAYVQIRQIVDEHKLPMHGVEERIMCGWASGKIDPSKDAVALVQQGIENARRIGQNLNQSLFAALLAESCIQIGEMATALERIGQGLTITSASGEDYFRPELYRLQGHCLGAAGNLEGPQSSFQKALELAQQQRAKSLELRVAISLSRLWVEQGKRTHAYDLLARTYNWFSEGFETADLRQAKELLLSLSA